MSNIGSSTVTVQILHVLLSSRKYKTVYLLLTNFKVHIENHIPTIITDSTLFLDYIYIYIWTHLLSLHYVLTLKIYSYIKTIIEPNVSLCM